MTNQSLGNRLRAARQKAGSILGTVALTALLLLSLLFLMGQTFNPFIYFRF